MSNDYMYRPAVQNSCAAVR